MKEKEREVRLFKQEEWLSVEAQEAELGDVKGRWESAVGSRGHTNKILVMEKLFPDKKNANGKKASLPDKLEVLVPGPDGEEATVELTVYPTGHVYIPERFGGLWRGIKHVLLLRRGEDESIWFYPV